MTGIPRLEPERRPGLTVELHGSLPPGAVPVYIYLDVLRQVLRHAEHHDHAGGLLQGSYCSGERGHYVEVDGFAAAGPVGSNTELAGRLTDSRDQHPRPVGWFHCRRAPGPGPTPQDLALHRAGFDEAWAPMLLIEQDSGRLTLFQVPLVGPPLSIGFWLVRKAG